VLYYATFAGALPGLSRSGASAGLARSAPPVALQSVLEPQRAPPWSIRCSRARAVRAEHRVPHPVPTLTIALAVDAAGLRIAYHRNRRVGLAPDLQALDKIFALTFAMGVVTGIVMSFQFGTNWPGYMNRVGAIAGPLGLRDPHRFFLEARSWA